MAETKNLKLYTTPSDDTTTSLKEWVQNIAGEHDSNMTKIDDAHGIIKKDIEDLQHSVEDNISNVVTELQQGLHGIDEDVDALSWQIEALEKIVDNLPTETPSGGVNLSSIGYGDDHILRLYDENGAELEHLSVKIECGTGGGGGGASTGFTVIMLNKTGATTVTAGLGNSCSVSYEFTSTLSSSNEPTGDYSASYEICKVTAAGRGQWEYIRPTETVVQGKKTVDIPADKIPEEGTYAVRVTCVDQGGNIKSMEWSVVVKAISLKTTLYDNTIFYGSIPFMYNPVGSGLSKTIKFEIDGHVFDERTTSQSNVDLSYTLNPTFISNYWKNTLKEEWTMHGAHVFRMWIESTIGGSVITSKPEKYTIVWVDSTSDKIIVAIKGYREMQQYTPGVINFFVYDPNNNPATVYPKVNGVDQPDRQYGRELQEWHYTPEVSGEHTFSITCGDVTESVVVDVKKSDIDITEVTDGLVWKFDPSGRSNNDVNRDEWSDGDVSMNIPDDFRWSRGGWGVDEDGYPCFTVPAGNKIDFNARLFGDNWKTYGHAFKIIFKTANVCDYDAEVASCLKRDENGNETGVGFKITAQNAVFKSAYQTIDVPLCEDRFTELEWNVTSTNENSEILTWLQGIPSSVKLYDQSDVFTQTEVLPITIGSNDCDVRIYGMREYSNSLSDSQMLNNWIMDAPTGQEMIDRYNRNNVLDQNGGIDPYKLADVHPDLRVIMLTCSHLSGGKEDEDWVNNCTVQHIMTRDKSKHSWIANGVRHRLQGTSSLNYKTSGCNLDFDFSDTEFVFTPTEVVLNSQVVQFDSSKVGHPDCNVVFAIDENYKYNVEWNGVNFACSAKKINIDGEEYTAIGNMSGILDGSYGEPFLILTPVKWVGGNEDVDTEIRCFDSIESAVISISEETVRYDSVYAMTDNSIGVNYFNLKVNIASSENANNACLTNEYQRFNPYLREARKNDPRVRDTMEFHPCVIFIKDLSGALFGDQEFHFYGGGDFGNSKKNKAAQGLDEQNPNECIVEIMGHEDRIQKWKEPYYTYEQWGSGETDILDFRFKNKVKTIEEQKDMFHRVSFWVASTDATAATGEVLPERVVYAEGVKNIDEATGRVEWYAPAGGVEYTTDSKEYRLSKFRNEFDEYFVSDSIMYYYLFTERYLMVDNRAKNSFWHTSDGIHWDHCFDYDNDTAFGANNTGHLILTYGMEDTDTRGAEGEETPVYSCSDSVLFCNVRDCFYDRLSEVFNLVEQGKRRDGTENEEGLKGWDAQRLLAEMDAYQALKPERVWIADMRRKYLRLVDEMNAGDENGKKEVEGRLEMLNGKKTLQRAQFETYQGPYCASKYISTSSKQEHITLRINPSGKGSDIKFKITPYCDMYINVQFVNMWRQVKAKKGQEVEISATASWEGASHADTYIYGASKIKGLSDLAAMKFGYCELNYVKKLQELIVSPYDETQTYQNVNLTGISVKSSPLLKRLSVCGCPNLKGSIDLSQSYLLEEVDLRQTGITGVSFANGGYLKVAKLPATISGLFARNMDDFSELTMEGVGALERLLVENCPKLNSTESNIGPLLNIVESCMSLGKRVLSGVKLSGVDWRMNRSGVLVGLSELNGIDDQYIISGRSEITGKVYVAGMSQSRYAFLTERYPALEIAYNHTLTDYTVRFINTDEDATILETQLIEAGSDAEDPTKRGNGWKPTKPQTAWIVYEFDQWDKGFTVVNSDLDIYALYTERPATYTVTWTDGTYIIGEPDIVEAGGSIVYSGPVLTLENHIWTGFDGVAENVLEDLTLTATFTELKQPSKPDFDTDVREFLYSDKTTDSSYYDLGEFMWIINSGEMNDYFYDYGKIKLVHNSNEVNADDKEIVLSLHSKDGHFRLSDGSSMAKTTWFMNGVLVDPMAMDVTAPHSNSGGYFASNVDNWLENTLYPTLPYHWKAIIKPVIVLANKGNMEIASEVRHLYIPSAAELVASMTYVPYGDEVDPDVENATFSSYTGYKQRIKGFYNGVGQPAYYWTRSAVSTDSTDFWLIAENGYAIEYFAQFACCICFGFSI